MTNRMSRATLSCVGIGSPLAFIHHLLSLEGKYGTAAVVQPSSPRRRAAIIALMRLLDVRRGCTAGHRCASLKSGGTVRVTVRNHVTNYWIDTMKNGWTPERKAKQAALIQTWRPWDASTGPKTDSGKLKSSRNADKPNSFNRRLRSLKAEVRRLLKVSKGIRRANNA